MDPVGHLFSVARLKNKIVIFAILLLTYFLFSVFTVHMPIHSHNSGVTDFMYDPVNRDAFEMLSNLFPVTKLKRGNFFRVKEGI